MWKRFLIIILLFGIVCFGLFVWIVSSPWATARISAALLKKSLRNVAVDELTIGRQRFVYPGQMLFFNVHARIKTGNENFKVDIKKLDLSGLQRITRMPADIDVYAEGLSIESDQIKISSGELTAKIFFNSFAMDRWKGVLVIPRMEAYRYEVQNMSVKLSGSIHNLSFNDLNADVYKGKVSGRLNVDWIKDVHYRTDIKFEGVDISALKEVDASVYGQIEGIIQGSVVIGGSAHNFDTLGLKAQITKDGRMNASLLKFVLPYMPRTEGSTNVFGLMKQGLKVPVEVANIEIHSVDEHKISGTVKLGVGQLNLDLNLPVDILYDGNLFSLIEWYKKLGK